MSNVVARDFYFTTLPDLRGAVVMTQSWGDTELVQACLNGNQSAWNELVRKYSRLVYSIALRNGLTSTNADDVLQNVFTITFQHLASLRDHKLLAAWLIRITYRECEHISKRNPPRAELDDTIPDPEDLPIDQVQIWERRYILRQAIERLEPSDRDLLKMLFFESPTPSYEAIAERLGMSVGSVGPTRLRSFKKLEAILLEMGFDFAE